MSRHHFITFGILSLAMASACIDPEGKYDDYVNRTNGLRGSGDASVTTDATSTVADITGDYFGACLISTFRSLPETSIMFLAQPKFTAAGTGGSLDIVFKAMKATSTTLDVANTLGNPLTQSAAAVDDKGAASLSFGNVTLPPEVNRVSGSEAVIEGAAMSFRILSKDSFCAYLSGQIVKPITLDLTTAPGTVCIFKRMKLGDSLPTFSLGGDAGAKVGFETSEFTCPK